MASPVSSVSTSLRSFIDTNILVYTDDPRDFAKQAAAVRTVASHLACQSGVVSLPVLQEYFTVATGKLRVAAEIAKGRVERFAKLNVVAPDLTDVLAAIDLHRLTRLSYWDALVIRCAKQGGCSVLLTEDMQHGQVIEGVRIVNPFL